MSKPAYSTVAPSRRWSYLNEVTAWWLANVADMRVLRDFKESPRTRHERERPELLPLPASTLTPLWSSIATSTSRVSSRSG